MPVIMALPRIVVAYGDWPEWHIENTRDAEKVSNLSEAGRAGAGQYA
jgi:hypothetical protein